MVNLIDSAKAKILNVASKIGNSYNAYKQTPLIRSAQNFNQRAGNYIVNKLQPATTLPRFEIPKKDLGNTALNTVRNIAYGIPESFMNIPRNLVVGGARLAEINTKRGMLNQKPKLMDYATAYAPIAEAGIDIGSFGVGSSIIKQGGKEVLKQGGKQLLKTGIKQAIKQSALKGAGYGAVGGLTYGLDQQYQKEFNPKQLLGNVVSGTVLGGILGGAFGGFGALKELSKKSVESTPQLRDLQGRWTEGSVPTKPSKMPQKAWEFQIKFNEQYKRNPYTPVTNDDIRTAFKYETDKRMGMQVRDINKDKNPLQTPEIPTNTANIKIKGEVPNSPTGIRIKTDQSVAQISKPILEKQLKGEISTRTMANEVVPSESIITQKGKLNIARLKVKGAGKKVLEEVNKTIQPTVIGNKEVIESAKLAKGTGAMTDEQMKKLLASQLKNRQVVVDLNARFNKAKKDGATEVELAKIMLDMANQSKVARQGGTFAGRLLQAQNIIADESASPMQKIFALMDNAGVSEQKYLKDAVKVNWENPTEVVNFYRKYVPPKFGEVLDEIRYSNMLSSPLTHIINTASNAMQTGIVAPVEKTITGVLDWGKSTLTGSERQYYASAGIDYAGGYVKALPEAFKKALKVLGGEEVLTKPDYQRMPTGSKGLLKLYTLPLRGLEAMDQFFKTLVESGVTSELKKGPQKLSSLQISSNATKEANYRLFRQAFDPNGELGQGGVLKYFDKWNSAIASLRKLPGGKWILPFLQTPTNILKQGVEFSPLGFSTAIGAKAPIEQLSKAIIGTGVFMGAYELARNGLTSWEAPTGEKERELYYAAGMQPYSIKIGNNWVSYSKLGPLSYPFAMASALAHAEKNNPDKSKIENVGKSVSGMLGFFGDQSYVKNIGEVVDAIQGGINIGPTALTSTAANLTGQLIPYKSFLTWLGRTIDPIYRKAGTFKEKLIKDIPIIGSSLEPYTDIYGNPSERDYPLLNAFSPYKVTKEKGGEAGMLEQYQDAKISKAVEKRADEKFIDGDKQQQITGNVYRYIDDEGNLKKINLDFTPPNLKLYGNSTIDKKVLSQYKSELTSRQSELIKLENLGAITPDEMFQQYMEIEALKTKATKMTPKKAKKVKLKKFTLPKSTFKAPAYKLKSLRNKKLKNLKVKRYKFKSRL